MGSFMIGIFYDFNFFIDLIKYGVCIGSGMYFWFFGIYKDGNVIGYGMYIGN